MKNLLLISSFVLCITNNLLYSQWKQLNPPFNENLYCARVVDSLVYYVAGAQGKVYKTIDGGDTWFDVSPSGSSDWYSMFFLDANHGWIGGRQSKVAKTSDGGSSWEIKTLVNSASSNVIETMFFYDNYTGYVAGGGFYNPDRETYIYKTTNGGNNWTLQLNLIGGILLEMSFVNKETGFVVGTSGGFFKTTNGGNNWSPNFLPTYKWLRAVYFINSKIGVVMGQNGHAWRTVDGGSSFSPVGTSMSSMIESVCFFNEKDGWAVGENGSINSTSNGGIDWNSYTLPTNEYLWSIHLLKKNGIIVGNNAAIFKYEYDPIPKIKLIQPNGGEILRSGFYYPIKWEKYLVNKVNIDYSSDGGNTWNVITTDISGIRYNWFVPYLNSSQCRIRLTNVDDPFYFVISDSNFTISNSVGVEYDYPTSLEYSLDQNFPNPFNLSCKIKFTVPKSSKVLVIIFNSLGQEVNKLVNSNFMPGIYEYDFNAQDLPSGIYYYRMITEEFNSIKKMVLLR